MSSRPTDFSRPTLAERIAATQAAQQPSKPAVGPARHAWADIDDVWTPALLLGWQHQADGWWGTVVTAQDGAPKVYLLAAARLRPVDTSAPARVDA